MQISSLFQIHWINDPIITNDYNNTILPNGFTFSQNYEIFIGLWVSDSP